LIRRAAVVIVWLAMLGSCADEPFPSLPDGYGEPCSPSGACVEPLVCADLHCYFPCPVRGTTEDGEPIYGYCEEYEEQYGSCWFCSTHTEPAYCSDVGCTE